MAITTLKKETNRAYEIIQCISLVIFAIRYPNTDDLFVYRKILPEEIWDFLSRKQVIVQYVAPFSDKIIQDYAVNDNTNIFKELKIEIIISLMSELNSNPDLIKKILTQSNEFFKANKVLQKITDITNSIEHIWQFELADMI